MPPTPYRVLIAEDHVIVTQLLAKLFQDNPELKLLGFAPNGREACEKCVALRPDLLILDVDLPLLNGVEVIARLVDDAPDTKILVFTGTTNIALLRACVTGGVAGVVSKTQTIDTLLEAIRAIRNGMTYFDPHILEAVGKASDKDEGVLHELTKRELDVFRQVAEGHTNKEIADSLGISVKTAETHRRHLMLKLGAKNAADITRQAFHLGIITPKGGGLLPPPKAGE